MPDHTVPLHLFPKDGEYHQLVGNYDGEVMVWILDGKVILEERYD